MTVEKNPEGASAIRRGDTWHDVASPKLTVEVLGIADGSVQFRLLTDDRGNSVAGMVLEGVQYRYWGSGMPMEAVPVTSVLDAPQHISIGLFLTNYLPVDPQHPLRLRLAAEGS